MEYSFGMMKRFAHWLWIKRDLHEADHKPPFFKEAELWWCYVGENIGIESNGKGDNFTRPILIFKKYDRNSFLALPLTTKNKTGTWYVSFSFYKTIQTVNLIQGRVYDYRRLKEKIGEISESDLSKIVGGYFELHIPHK